MGVGGGCGVTMLLSLFFQPSLPLPSFPVSRGLQHLLWETGQVAVAELVFPRATGSRMMAGSLAFEGVSAPLCVSWASRNKKLVVMS